MWASLRLPQSAVFSTNDTSGVLEYPKALTLIYQDKSNQVTGVWEGTQGVNPTAFGACRRGEWPREGQSVTGEAFKDVLKGTGIEG